VSVGRAIFQKIASAKASGGGNLIRDGRYEFTILKLLLEDKFNGTCFIAEMLVESAGEVEQGVEPNRVGSTCSYVVNFDGEGKLSAPGNVKLFVLALLNKGEDELDADQIADITEKLVAPSQPARGMRIADETYRKTIRSGKNAGKPFTAHRWKHVDGQTDESINERRKQLDAESK
jgi:hypothetical protein